MNAPVTVAPPWPTSSVAASSSGPSGAQSCHASVTAATSATGQTTCRRVATAGAGSVAKRSDVTTPNPPARAPQRPEEVLVPLGVAGDHAAVGEDDLRAEQRVRRQPVHPAEEPDAPAEREPGDADS